LKALVVQQAGLEAGPQVRQRPDRQSDRRSDGGLDLGRLKPELPGLAEVELWETRKLLGRLPGSLTMDPKKMEEGIGLFREGSGAVFPGTISKRRPLAWRKRGWTTWSRVYAASPKPS
jgi:hypothetical protein